MNPVPRLTAVGRGLSFWAAVLAVGCTASRPAAPLLRGSPAALRPALPLAKLAPMPFIAAYEVFRDSAPAVWGHGMRLGASWRLNLPEGAALSGLAAVPREGVLVAHSVPEGWNDVLRRLDPAGQEAAAGPFPRYVRGLDILGTGRDAVLLAHEMYRVQVLSWDGRPLWATEKTGAQFAAADLDGDRRPELLAAGGYTGEVAAYDREGKPLWTRADMGHISDLAGGRFLLGPADGVAVLTAGPRESGVTLLDSKGKTLASLAEPCAPLAGTGLDRKGGTALLAILCSGHGAERLRLKLLEAAEGALRVVGENVLGWSELSALRAADLDGDGADELVLGTTAGWVLVYSNRGEWLSERHWFGRITDLAAGDVDGDGREEVVVGVGGHEPAVYLVQVEPGSVP